VVSSQIDHGDKKVCTVQWSWEKKVNDFQTKESHSDYIIHVGNWYREHTSLGEVKISIYKREQMEET
jgi:hypothetical protein